MDVQVRQATLEDQERIGQFLQVAYQDRAQFKFPARWLWEYVDNPFWDGDGLPIWLAEADGKIVGQTCEMMVPLKLGDNIYRAAWGVDFIVLPEYRRRGIGQLLQQAQIGYHDIFMVLTMSPISRQVLVSQGFAEIDTVAELGKTMRFDSDDALGVVDAKLGRGNALARMCRRLRLGGLVAPVLSSLARLRDARRLRARDRGLVIEQVERFGDEIDQLWDQLASRFSAIVPRDAAYLNWKFVEQPHVRYERFVVRQAGAVCGYVITRVGIPPEPNIGIIADVFAAPDDDVLPALLVHATKHLRRAGVKAILSASSLPSYVAHFLRLGFKETRRMVPMFHCQETIDPGMTGAPQKWFLSMGDHDWDQYPQSVVEQG